MSERVQYPQWRAENETTRYPFAERATLTNGGQLLLDGTFLDASLFPVGGTAGMYLSAVTVDHDRVTLTVGDDADDALASGSFDLLRPPDSVALKDAYGRPAGLIVSESRRLGVFAAWGVGTFAFTADQTGFAATVCHPVPARGVRGLRLPDGTVLTGDVWLVGDDGVVLRRERVTLPPAACGGPGRHYEVVRVDVVGDPLFRRRLCTPTSLFSTPRFLREIVLKDGAQRVVLGPGEFGNVKVTVNNDLATTTVLRVHPTEAGNRVEVVGSQLQSVK